MDEMNNGFVPTGDPEADKRAKNAMIIGIVGIVCGLCCTYAGVILGIIGLVKANGLAKLPDLSADAQKNVKVAKICSIVAIAMSAVMIVINIIMMVSGNNAVYNMLTEAGM